MSDIDVLETNVQYLSPQLLALLLIDQTKTLHSSSKPQNIFWANADYEMLGPKFAYDQPITPELITGNNGQVIECRYVL